MDRRIRKAAEGLWTFDHEPADGKNAVIITRRGAFAVDTGNEPADGELMADFIRQQGLSADRLILTHGHGDHVFGGAAFSAAEVYAGHLCARVIRGQVSRYVERFGGTEAEAERALVRPTVTFRERLVIDGGDCSLELFPTPGHSPDHVSVFVPERGVLVAGDTVVTAIPPAIHMGDSRALETSLQQLITLGAGLIVAGHGQPLEGREKGRRWLEETIRYLQAVRERVGQSLGRGEDEEAAVRAAPFDQLIGGRLPRDRFRMEWRHQMVVKKIFSEESA